MTEIGFYHLTATPLERALPRLLERTLQAGRRAVVLAGSEERVQALNGLLWTYEDGSWLPHGSARDGFAADQPVWLTAVDGNPNAATYLFLTDAVAAADPGAWERIFDLFDGRDAAAVAAARGRWKSARGAGHALTYWRQTDGGGWEKAG